MTFKYLLLILEVRSSKSYVLLWNMTHLRKLILPNKNLHIYLFLELKIPTFHKICKNRTLFRYYFCSHRLLTICLVHRTNLRSKIIHCQQFHVVINPCANYQVGSIPNIVQDVHKWIILFWIIVLNLLLPKCCYKINHWK